MKAMKADEERYSKVAIYGKSGTGKTWVGTTAPKPLFLLSERQGMSHIKESCAMRGIETPPVLFMETLQDYRDVLRAVHGDRDQPFVVRDKEGTAVFQLEAWPETLVIDTLTDALEKVRQEIYREAPRKTASDGLPDTSRRHWSVLKERCELMIRAFRDAPCNVVFLCQMDDKTIETSDGNSARVVEPDLPMRSLPDILCQCVNVVGYTVRREEAERDDNDNLRRVYRYEVRTTGPAFMTLKPSTRLSPTEPPDLSVWFAKLDKAPDAPSQQPPKGNGKRKSKGSSKKQEEASDG